MGKSSVPEAWLNPVGSPKFRADTCPLIFNWTQKKRHVVSFLIVRKVSVRFRNVVRLAFQARPFHRLKIGGQRTTISRPRTTTTTSQIREAG